MLLLRQLVVLLAAAVLVTGCAHKRGGVRNVPEEVSVQQQVQAVADRLDVQVHLLGLDADEPPKVGKRTTMEPVAEADVQRLLPTFEQVLATYPAPTRVKLVRNVWLVGKLKIGNVPFRGMAHSSGRFELALRPRTRPYDLFGTMHHEIGHLFELRPGFDRDTWRSFSDGSYLGRHPDQKWDPKAKGQPWLALGFVSKYASKNVHEDFAEMAELSFSRPDLIRTYYDQYPLIRAKMDFLTSYYLKMAPGIALPWIGDGWLAWKQDHPRMPRQRKRRGEADAPPQS